MLAIKPNATHVPKEIKNEVLFQKLKWAQIQNSYGNQSVCCSKVIYVIYNNHSHNFVNMHLHVAVVHKAT